MNLTYNILLNCLSTYAITKCKPFFIAFTMKKIRVQYKNVRKLINSYTFLDIKMSNFIQKRFRESISLSYSNIIFLHKYERLKCFYKLHGAV